MKTSDFFFLLFYWSNNSIHSSTFPLPWIMIRTRKKNSVMNEGARKKTRVKVKEEDRTTTSNINSVHLGKYCSIKWDKKKSGQWQTTEREREEKQPAVSNRITKIFRFLVPLANYIRFDNHRVIPFRRTE